MKCKWEDKSVVEIWREYDEMERQLAKPLSQRMLELANIGPGMHVLDIATGRGEPAIPAAQIVGEAGSVLGFDIEESMLEMTRARAQAEGVRNLTLQVCDAECFVAEPGMYFDAILARWCLMYFQNPILALKAARNSMKAGAKLVAALWAEPERVDYYTFPRQILGKLHPTDPLDINAPGTFAYSDVDRIHRDFDAAGLKICSIEEMYIPVMRANSAERLIQWTRAFGLNRLLKGLPADIQSRWESEMIRQSHAVRFKDEFQLGGVSRILVATRNE